MRLQHGDVLMVTRLERLARSTRDLLNILHAIGKTGVKFGRPAKLTLHQPQEALQGRFAG